MTDRRKSADEIYTEFHEEDLLEVAKQLDDDDIPNPKRVERAMAKLCRGLVSVKRSQMTNDDMKKTIKDEVERVIHKVVPELVRMEVRKILRNKTFIGIVFILVVFAMEILNANGINIFGFLRRIFN